MSKKSFFLKRGAVIVLVLSFLMGLCGCIQYEAHAEVNDDGTMDFGLLYAVIDLSDLGGDSDDSSMDMTQSLDTIKDALEKDGWDITDYQTNTNGQNYVGFRIEKHNIPIDKFQEELDKMKEAGMDMGNFTITKDGDTYKLEWDMSSSMSSMSSSGADSASLSQYGGFMRFTLNLPNAALKDNATKTSDDGCSLTWDITTMKDPMRAEFTLDGSSRDDDDDDDKGSKKDKKDKDDDDDEDEDDSDSKSSKKKSSKKSKKSSSSDGMPTWLLITIIGGGVLVVGAVVAVIIVVVKKGKKDQTPNA